MLHIPLNDLAEKVLLKFLMDKLPNFYDQNAYSFAIAVWSMAGLGCKNKEFWKLVEQKLIHEEIYRYIPLH